MRLDFLHMFQDPYLRRDEGRGVFLAGVVLGMLARGQVGGGQAIDTAPLFKQLHFGKMQRRDLRKHLARVPELVRAYNLEDAEEIESLCGVSGDLLLKGDSQELGVDGNFAFSVGFLNAFDYFFKRIFPKKKTAADAQPEEQKEDDKHGI